MITRLHVASRVVLGTIFLLSGVLKLVSPDQASELLSQLSSLDPSLCKILVIALSLFEMTLGTMLFVGKKYLQASALVSAFVLLLFTFVGVVTVQNPRSCGCFGEVLEMKTDEYLVLRNIVLLLVSMFILRFPKALDSEHVEHNS